MWNRVKNCFNESFYRVYNERVIELYKDIWFSIKFCGTSIKDATLGIISGLIVSLFIIPGYMIQLCYAIKRNFFKNGEE